VGQLSGVYRLSSLPPHGAARRDDITRAVTVPVDRLPRGSGAVIAHRSARRLVTVRSGRLEATEPARSVVDA
jgi:hypothetical protein